MAFEYKERISHWTNFIGMMGLDPRHARIGGYNLSALVPTIYTILNTGLWYDVTELFINQKLRSKIGFFLQFWGSNSNPTDIQWKVNNIEVCSTWFYYGGVFQVNDTDLKLWVRNTSGTNRSLTQGCFSYIPKEYYNEGISNEHWNTKNETNKKSLIEKLNEGIEK